MYIVTENQLQVDSEFSGVVQTRTLKPSFPITSIKGFDLQKDGTVLRLKLGKEDGKLDENRQEFYVMELEGNKMERAYNKLNYLLSRSSPNRSSVYMK